MSLVKGELVVMHTCLEAEGKNNGKVWLTASDEFKSNSGSKVIFLEGFSGYFCTEFLQKVNLPISMKEIVKIKEKE